MRRVAAVALATVLFGCNHEARTRLLVVLFDGAAETDAPGAPMVRKPRRNPAATPTPTAPDTESSALAPKTTFDTWNDVTRLFAKDEAGNPDWTVALREGVIAPLPGIAPEAKDQPIVDLDVEMTPPSGAGFKVVFSHASHGGWLGCANCHDGIFERRAGQVASFGAAAHDDGACGACHGKVAFDIAGGCSLCHLKHLPRSAEGDVDWDRALEQHLVAPGESPRRRSEERQRFDTAVPIKAHSAPNFEAVMPHATHTRWLSCANCHPQPFSLEQTTAGVAGIELHSQRYCGSCHGSVAFGFIGSCGRCHPATGKARQHETVLDLDVPVTGASGTRTFSHSTHTRFLECANCHTGLYGSSDDSARITVADVYAGEYCGTCHAEAVGAITAHCQRCHPPEAPRPAPVREP